MKTTYYSILLLLVAGLFFSCGNSKDGMSSNDNTSEDAELISKKLSDFYAEAPDSSWILRVQFDSKVYFEDINKGLKFSGDVDELHVAQGADVVGISAKSNSHILRLSIDIVDCGNNGKNVDVMLRNKDKKDGTNYSSCGYYRGNPKLHGVWAVEAIDQKALNADKFPKDIPHFEINLETKHFGGFAGCNQVNGQMKFEYNKMNIAPLASTKMYCADVSDIENKILNILRSGPVVYTLKSGKLILENPKGSLTLKSVD
tara:strand:- start:17995 stop:18768 length:774 start_codon:yes stop_codon:yes gene_type:complete